MSDTCSNLLPQTPYGRSPQKRLLIGVTAAVLLVCGSVAAVMGIGRIQTVRYTNKAAKEWADFLGSPVSRTPTAEDRRAQELIAQCIKTFRFSTPPPEPDTKDPTVRRERRAPRPPGKGTFLVLGRPTGPTNLDRDLSWDQDLPFLNGSSLRNPAEPLPESARTRTRDLVELNQSIFPLLHEAFALPMEEARRSGHETAVGHLPSLMLMKALVDADAGSPDSACEAIMDVLSVARQKGARGYSADYYLRQRLRMRSQACDCLQFVLTRGLPKDQLLGTLEGLLAPLDERDAIIGAVLFLRLDAARTWSRTPYPVITSRLLGDLDALVVATRAGTLRQSEVLRKQSPVKSRWIPDYVNAAAWGIVSTEESLQTDATRMAAARVLVAAARYRTANGKWPDSLDALVPTYCPELPRDPVSGDPLRYERDAAKGSVVISVGDAARGEQPTRLEVHDRPVAATKES